MRARPLITFALLSGAALPTGAAAADWQMLAARQVQAAKTTPAILGDRKLDCDVRLRLRVSPSGRIVSSDIIEGCRSIFLMREVGHILKSVGDLPPPPSGKPAVVEVDLEWHRS